MKKLFAIISVLLCAVLVLTACSSTTEPTTAETEAVIEKTTVNIGLLKGPTGMGAAKLLDMSSYNQAGNIYNPTIAGSADVLTSGLIDGSLDICALPTNAAAVLYNKTQGKVKILAVNTLGVMYIMSSDENVKSLSDLAGKTVYSSGQGSSTEYVLNYLLDKNGIEDVNIVYAAEHAEVLAGAVAGNYDTVLLPEPFVTQMKMKSDKFTSVIDLTAEWEKLGGGLLTMGCVAVRTEFAENNPDAVESFLVDYATSVDYAKTDIEGAAAIIEKFEIATAAVAKSALPNCNITCMTGEEMKENVSAYLDVLYSFDATSVGGSIPGDDFWY